MAEYLLADEGPGDGGFAVVAGSHKANLPMPKSLSLMEDHTHAVTGMPSVDGCACACKQTNAHIDIDHIDTNVSYA